MKVKMKVKVKVGNKIRVRKISINLDHIIWDAVPDGTYQFVGVDRIKKKMKKQRLRSSIKK